MPFEFEETEIPGVIYVQPEVFEDERGYLLETYDEGAFREFGIDNDFVLDFYSRSKRNTLRGLHFQRSPYEQAKLVHCLTGEIYDVAVDIRQASPTYGEYVGRHLSGSRKDELFIPRGFAHGFLTLSDEALVQYKVDNEYAPSHEAGVIWKDPEVEVDWPLDEEPLLSEKDDQWPSLSEVTREPEST